MVWDCYQDAMDTDRSNSVYLGTSRAHPEVTSKIQASALAYVGRAESLPTRCSNLTLNLGLPFIVGVIVGPILGKTCIDIMTCTRRFWRMWFAFNMCKGFRNRSMIRLTRVSRHTQK